MPGILPVERPSIGGSGIGAQSGERPDLPGCGVLWASNLIITEEMRHA